jgi:hypothetical protein
MIRDLEELLLSIPEPALRDYMREAIRAYHAGAFRAAVVVAVAAGMDDLRKKLSSLASHGGASPQLKTAASSIEQAFNAQQAFEADLILAAESHASLVTPAEAKKLGILLKTRHLCAHPSGHEGTAEEARDAISSIIDLTLSRPALMGIAGVDVLLSRLAGAHFFPKRHDLTAVQAVVAQELSTISSRLYPALIAKAIERLSVVAKQDGAPPVPFPMPPRQSDEQLNLISFLCGCPGHSSELRDFLWRKVARLLDQTQTASAALALISCDPGGPFVADSLTRDRCVSLVRTNFHERSLDRTRVTGIVAHWMSTPGLLDEVTREDLVRYVRAYFVDRLSPASPTVLCSLGIPALEQDFFANAIDEAGSSTWNTSNAAISIIQSLSPEQAQRVPQALRAKYVIQVSSVGFGPSASNQAVPLVTSGFGPRLDWLDSVPTEIAANPLLLGTCFGLDGLVRALSNNGRTDLAIAVLDTVASSQELIKAAWYVLPGLAKHGDQRISQKVLSMQSGPEPQN